MITLIGQVLVDVSMPSNRTEEPKLRLGGIMHAARALWAMGRTYQLAYFCPAYLDRSVDEYARAHGAGTLQKVGDVQGSPNVIIAREPKEIGPQGYELLLRDESRVSCDSAAITRVLESAANGPLCVFPGGFPLADVLASISKSTAPIYIDVNYGPDDLAELDQLGRPVDCAILSTSSPLFTRTCGAKVSNVVSAMIPKHAKSVLFKENRGGSRLFSGSDPQPVRAWAQTRRVQHSIGVGDCFNVAFAVLRSDVGDRSALAYASMIAAEYAATTYPDDFRTAVQGVLALSAADVVELEGVSLHWEDRPDVPIYVAAPDFDYVNREAIDRVAECLRYHNFVPRLPVRENGQATPNMPSSERHKMFEADVRLLTECKILVAVLLFDDPGTLIEIGLAAAMKKPVIVFDPYHRATNLMLTHLPDVVSSDLDDIICAVFDCAARLQKAGS